MNTLDICNAIRREVERVDDSGFPFDVFPAVMQKIILDAVQYNSLNLEFLSTAMLSAATAAVGNAFSIHIRGDWYTNCALFFVLVGDPGTGKTPALHFALKPLRDYDMELANAYRKELESYHRSVAESGKNSSYIEKPRKIQFIFNDYTPETLYQRHYYNQRGVLVNVDEILALIKSRSRYSSDNKIIEDLLSAFSGEPINYTRKNEESHIIIPIPCINLVGGIQESLLHHLFTPEFISNGFTDRLLFVAPENLTVPLWDISEESESEQALQAQKKWNEIIRKILAVECNYREGDIEIIPTVLRKSDEARRLFYAWNNENANLINSIAKTEAFDSHLLKLNGIVPRLALVLQVLRWATGESHVNFVDEVSMQGALRLIDYYNRTYARLKAIALSNETRDVNEVWFNMLSDEFTTEQALDAWTRVGLKRRSLFAHLKHLCTQSNPSIIKVSLGHYRKTNSNDSQK